MIIINNISKKKLIYVNQTLLNGCFTLATENLFTINIDENQENKLQLDHLFA